MSFDIHGWIEVTSMEPDDPCPEHAWRGVLKIGPLVDVADDISERLFALSKRCVTENSSAFAARRGLPVHPSAELRREIEDIAAFEAQYGPGEIGGYTHATWAELKTVVMRADWQSSEWRLIFGFLELLEADGRYKPDRVRLTVWYCW